MLTDSLVIVNSVVCSALDVPAIPAALLVMIHISFLHSKAMPVREKSTCHTVISPDWFLSLMTSGSVLEKISLTISARLIIESFVITGGQR